MDGSSISDEPKGSGVREKHDPQSIAFVLAALAGLALSRLHSHLLFHSLAEWFTVAVAFSVFFLAWNARRFLDNHYLLLLGLASLFVGTVDSLHALTYKGIGALPAGDAGLPTQLWIIGRYLQAASFLVAPLFLSRRLHSGVVFGVYAAAVTILLATVFLGWFPACYVEGAGLTSFKIASEYAVVAVLAASTWLLVRRRFAFHPSVFRNLVASLLLTAAAELMFTLYTDVYGVFNVVGHLLRFLAFCALYQAIVVTGVSKPFDLLFRNLAHSEEALRHANTRLEAVLAALRQSEERYRVFVSNSSEAICRIELERPIPTSVPEDDQLTQFLESACLAECNEAYALMHGVRETGQLAGRRLTELLSRSRPSATELLRAFIASGYRMEVELCDKSEDGSLRHIAGSYSGAVEDGCLVRVWAVQRDVTERKRAAAEREQLIADLQQALAEVKTLSGLLPICANCKNIRDDKGYWTQVEAYLSKRAHVSFSHSICPDCLQSLYPDFCDEVAARQRHPGPQ